MSSAAPSATRRVTVICRDAEGSAAPRAAHMKAHFAYIESALADYLLAGPLFDASGERIVGSVLVFRTDDVARARAIVEGDPYFKAGVWDSIEYFPFLPAAGEYIGGRIW
jgi:hypothetical protein